MRPRSNDWMLVIGRSASKFLATLRCRPLLGLVWGLVFAHQAQANEFDLKEWLNRPGVQAVAVDFYASWCKPCMEAMPRWKALQERYGKQGLRVVLVKKEDPEIRSLGWTPDVLIDDPDGQLAKQFGVESLPQSFVWSWSGKLLVRGGEIGEVEQVIDRTMKETPRIAITPAAGVPAALVESIKLRLTDTGKILVVADPKDREKLLKELKAQQSSHFDEAHRCEIGKELPPNAILKISITGKLLTLGLVDIESGCQKQTVQVPWDAAAAKNPRRTAIDAVEGLIAKIRGPIDWGVKKVTATPAAKPVDSRPSLALLGLAAANGFDSGALGTVEELLLGSMDATGRLHVIGVNDVGSALGPEKRREILACGSDKRCIAEKAGAAQVDFLGTGDVGKLGSLIVLTLKVIDARTGNIVARAQKTAVNEAALPTALQDAASELLKGFLAAPTPAVSAPTAPAKSEADASSVRSGRLGGAFWALAGTALAGAAAGGYFGYSTLARAETAVTTLDIAEYRQSAADASRDATISTVAFGIAGASAIAASLVALLSGNPAETPPVSVAPASGTIAVSGHF